MEQKSKCPLCNDLYDNCFVEQTVIEDKPFESYMCFQCGMTSNSYLAFDSDKLEEYTKSHSELMNDLKIMDEERGIAWFPSVINMGEKGIIYPDGTLTDWHWHYAKVIDIPEKDREKNNLGRFGLGLKTSSFSWVYENEISENKISRLKVKGTSSTVLL